MTIVQSNEERDTILDLSPTSVLIQRHGTATLTANGKTVTSNFSAMIFLDPAGDVVMDVSTDPPTVVHEGGPHQQLSGDVAALCGYFADP
jgi:hypothetical protein